MGCCSASEVLTFCCTAHEQSIGGGETFKMAAEVGLLSRNVRIQSQEYSTMQSDAFGGRVLISSYSGLDDSGNFNDYTGFARLKDVEFKNMGQEGFTEPYDPRLLAHYFDYSST